MAKWLIAAALLLTGGWLQEVGSAQQQKTSIWAGVYTEAQAARGRVVYEQRCARCHGRNLEGLSSAFDWRGQPPLADPEFRRNWIGLSMADLSERIRISMPQENPGSLRRPQVADVLAYLLQQNGYPLGDRELPADKEALARIVFEDY
jgi:mono/diheme cytochrome c family protein